MVDNAVDNAAVDAAVSEIESELVERGYLPDESSSEPEFVNAACCALADVLNAGYFPHQWAAEKRIYRAMIEALRRGDISSRDSSGSW